MPLLTGLALRLAVTLAQAPPAPAAAVPADTAHWRTSLKAGVNLNEAVLSDNC